MRVFKSRFKMYSDADPRNLSGSLFHGSGPTNPKAAALSDSLITGRCNSRSLSLRAIGLYRDVWIAAIASSTTSLATRTAAICVRFQGRRVRRVYVTMQITFLTRKSALIYRRGLRQRVASLTLNCNGDFAIRAYRWFFIFRYCERLRP